MKYFSAMSVSRAIASLVLLCAPPVVVHGQSACAQLGVNCSHPTTSSNGSNNRGSRSNNAPPSAAEIAGRQATALNDDGIKAYERGDWAAADAFFRKSLENMPNAPVVHKNLAYTQNREGVDAYKAGNYAAALNYFQQAMANVPAGDPGTQLIRDDLVAAQGKIAEAKREQEQSQKDKITANNMQQSIQSLAQTLNAAPPTGGLDFNDGKSSPAAIAKNGGTSKGLDFADSSASLADSSASLKDAVKDSPSDHNEARGAFGSKVANPGSTDLTPDPAGATGSDTKAGDQLLSAAATADSRGDLRTNYDRGGAQAVGSLKVPTKPSFDPATFSPRVKNDPRMVTALKQLDALNAKRTQLSTELERLTVARNLEKDPQISQELTKQLNQQSDDVQANLLSITKAEATVKKTKRTIETEVEGPKGATAKP